MHLLESVIRINRRRIQLLHLLLLLLRAAVLLLLPRDEKTLLRWLALIFSLGTLALILVAWFNYDRVDAGFQFQH